MEVRNRFKGLDLIERYPTDNPHCMEKELMVSLQAQPSKAQTFD